MFEVAAEAYDRFMGRYAVRLAPQFADLAGVQPGQRVLDVGCGPGALTAELVARLGAENVAAVDPSESFLSALRERHPGVVATRAPAEDLPLPDASFDTALAQLVVHFMKDPVRGFSEGGLMSVLFAATYPERVTALVLYGTFAKRIWSPDYPWAPKPDARAREIENLERNWATRMDLDQLAPSEDEAFKRRLATYFRRSASPGAAVALLRMNTLIDVRDVLPTIQAPTLLGGTLRLFTAGTEDVMKPSLLTLTAVAIVVAAVAAS